MSIIQISKIQQRYGELVDLPQLDQAEFGFAADVNRLFIGKTTGNTENVEVLTAYSDIAFSQLDGAGNTNLNINNSTLANGQVLVYDGDNWVNRGGGNPGYINLGDVGNVAIEGGGINYVLTTDGTGNLSWTPKSFTTANIANITQANPGIVTTAEDIYLTNGSEITITRVNGMTEVNGQSYFIGNLTSNSFALYTDVTLTTPVDTTGFSTYTSGGIISCASSGSEGSANAAGANTTIQFNYNNLLYGDSDFTYDFVNNKMILSGTANITNINSDVITANTANFANITLGGPFTTTAITTGANTTAGTITGNWTLTSGSKLQSTYADLAEYYSADKSYTPGTVLEFGGDKEVTIAKEESTKIAGVVSHDPAYVMNGDIQTEFPCILALIGRVKVKVIGWVSKGDMLVSAGNGYAKTSIMTPKIGTVIGKAIENKTDTGEGMVEVMVGRL